MMMIRKKITTHITMILNGAKRRKIMQEEFSSGFSITAYEIKGTEQVFVRDLDDQIIDEYCDEYESIIQEVSEQLQVHSKKVIAGIKITNPNFGVQSMFGAGAGEGYVGYYMPIKINSVPDMIVKIKEKYYVFKFILNE
jgi:hypothetical protein